MGEVERPYSFPEIVTVLNQRRSADAPLLRQMIDVRDRYNGEIVVPLPDVEGAPDQMPPTPRLLADAIDFMAMRATSTRPALTSPAMDSAKVSGKRSREYAAIRRRALYASWHNSAVGDVILRRAYRHLAGYGTACLVVVPDFVNKRARVEMRDPLTTYPELRTPEDFHAPRNVGFVYGRSAQWIVSNYPEAEPFVARAHQWDTLWDLVEWIDGFDVVVGILGPRSPVSSVASQPQRQPFGGLELRRWPNRAGVVPVGIPRRVTLDRILSQVANMIPVFDLMGRMTALDVLAAEKAVFADMVLIGKDGRPPQLVAGEWKDGRSGEVNELLDGDAKLLQSSPGPMTQPIIDRLERNIRVSTGLLPAAGGETGGNLRTGRAIDTVGGFSIDPRVQEAQELMARALMVVNQGIMETEKGYWPERKYVVFSGWPGDGGLVEYTPAKHFETTENVVAYAFPGSDISEVSVTVGQLVGAELISKHSGRQKHPMVDDPDAEEERITEEQITHAFLGSLSAQAQQPGADPTFFIDLLDSYRSGRDLIKAARTAHGNAQQKQADAQMAQQGAAAPPEQQPGLAAIGGQGGPPPPAPGIPPPNPSQVDFKQLLRAISAQPTRAPAPAGSG